MVCVNLSAGLGILFRNPSPSVSSYSSHREKSLSLFQQKKKLSSVSMEIYLCVKYHKDCLYLVPYSCD